MVTLDRRLPALDYSLFRFFKTAVYTAGAVTGTLEIHHAPLAITGAYPDDLVTMTRSTLAVTVPQTEIAQDITFFGGALHGYLCAGVVYGFVVAVEPDRQARFYQSRLMGDVTDLLIQVAADEGLPIYDGVDPAHPQIGEVEVINVRARSLPENAPGLVAARMRFVVEFEMDLV